MLVCVMKTLVIGALTAAIAATLSLGLEGAIGPHAGASPSADADLVSQSYLYRGTGRRQILA